MKEFLHPQSEIGEPTKLGEALTIVGHPFGHPVSNEALLNIALNLGLPVSEIEDARKAISATGFKNRFISHDPGEKPDMEKAVKRTVGNGATLLKETTKAHGWADGIDVFIDTSAFLPTSINKEILIEAGLNPDRIISRSYRYACAGAIGAFIDCLSDPTLRDARIVIGALEPLSLVIGRSDFISPKTLSIPAIFGDANTFIAFTPNHFHLNVREILVQPDAGVIKLKTLYDFDKTPSDPASIPPHYSFAGGGESIFHYSESGAYLKIDAPETDIPITMDGKRTAFFFGDETTKVITRLLEWTPNLLNELNGKNIIMHPASLPVVNRIAKLLWRNTPKFLDAPSLPFLMDVAGYSNGSSATTLNRWRYMIEKGMIDTRLPMLWIAPGIGSAIAGAIGRINP